MTQRFSIGSFVFGLMLGVLLAGMWFGGGTRFSLPDWASPSSATTTAHSSSQEQESDSISVANQPAGTSVSIESVTVPPPGVWVAVREKNGNELGNVLGAERVAGPRSLVTVSLLRATEPGHAYAVELYRDDANGLFDVASNSVYVDFDTGAPVIASFVTTGQ